MTAKTETVAERGRRSFWETCRIILEMIKFSHTVFALPFAIASLLLASPGGVPDPLVLFWIVIAMVTARNAAMAFNRWADHDIDAANPRTAERALPKGDLTRRSVLWFILVNVSFFFLASFMLNTLALILSPLVMATLLLYSYTKRVTSGSHLVLGLCLALAPFGAWVAARGVLDAEAIVPVLLGAAVLCWVAGFDIIYSCQDAGFDRRTGLHSIPARFGIRRALLLAKIFHALTIVLLFVLAKAANLGTIYLVGIAITTGLLVWEHRLVRADDLSKIGIAFFNVNGMVSFLVLFSIALDLFL